MTELQGRVLARLDALADRLGPPSRYVVAYSGGLDSTVLLRCLAGEGSVHRHVIAVHIDHQLQAASAQWANHAATAAAAMGVECRVERVAPDTAAGRGLEAAAREARYTAFAALMREGDWLLSAHHLDDQAETLLLNLVRGSGPDGLAAMPAARAFGPGWLVRPLLDEPRHALAAFAADHGLEWIEDPSNAEQDFDRNYLRHSVLPKFEDRWPDAARRLARSIERMREARELLAEVGREDLARLGSPARLDIAGLAALSASRQRNALRAALRACRLPLPSSDVLEAIREDLLPARKDAVPLVAWPGGEARRYRGKLHLMAPLEPSPGAALALESDRLELPGGLGMLTLEPDADAGLDPRVVARGLSVRWRKGGEELRPARGGPTRSLKKLLQEAGIVPWMRERLPLIYAGSELVAVADRFVAAEAQAAPGTAVRWLDHPELD